MTRTAELKDGNIILHGDTFKIKESLKIIGARWNSTEKKWMLNYKLEHIETLKSLDFIFDTVEKSPISWNIKDFLNYATSIIKANLSDKYWIIGEVTNSKFINGNIYFDLSESNELKIDFKQTKAHSISCVIWQSNIKNILEKQSSLPIQDGLKIKVLSKCHFRPDTAKLTLNVEDIDLNFSHGELFLKKKKILNKIKELGVYEKNKQLKINKFPIKIALITSVNSRAQNDFLDELRLSKISFKITIFDCSMQGEDTSKNISQALKKINTSYKDFFECIVIARGGGSRLDLRWFDDLDICLEIADSAIPVITAIGHFDDSSAADEVAWRNEKTPTAAANYITNTINESLKILDSRITNVRSVLTRRLTQAHKTIDSYQKSILTNVKNQIHIKRESLRIIMQSLKILSSSAFKPLKQGYAIVYDKDQKNLLKASDFLTNQNNKIEKISILMEDIEQKYSIKIIANIQEVIRKNITKKEGEN